MLHPLKRKEEQKWVTSYGFSRFCLRWSWRFFIIYNGTHEQARWAMRQSTNRHQSPEHSRHQPTPTPVPPTPDPPDTSPSPRHKGGGLLSWTYNDTRPPSKNEYWGKPLSSTTHDTSNRRRGKREAVLPPLHTLAAYTSQKSFISLDLKQHPGVREKFLPLSGEKGWKRGGFLFRGKKGESWLR